MLKIFKKKQAKNKRGIVSNSFGKLISDAVFINENVNKLDFMNGIMFSKSSLKGTIYVSNIQPSLSDIDDVNKILDRIDLVDMIYLFTDSDSADIYQSEYVSHTITDSYIEVSLKNGQTSRLNY